ncbi:MAG: hypothetical protein AAGH68_13280 [Pseudomonadota bacterium]
MGNISGRYAVLGWGSLIWDLDNLAPHVALPWHMRAGPQLPMEFCRVSPKRKMGLAVCLDAEHGVACPTHAVASKRTALSDVIADLAARERAPLDLIGGVCTLTAATRGRAEIAEVVHQWCKETGWVGAVWTDLRANYDDHLGVVFSVDHAVGYLQGLTGESLDEAVRYIHFAPQDTDTPLRRALAGNTWWQGQVARLTAD